MNERLTVLVTGCDGQLGSELRKLVKSGCCSFCRFLFVDVNVLDICNRAEVHNYFKTNHVDVVVNCAAYTAVDRAESDSEAAFAVNRDGVSILAECCVEEGAFMIHVSTDYVFDGLGCVPYKEDDPTYPTGAYGRTKLAGERAVIESGCHYLIFRTAWLYSPYGKNFVKTMMKLTAEKDSLNVVFDQVGTPTCAADLAALIYKIIAERMLDHQGIYHFSNEGVCSWYDFAVEIRDLCGNTCEIRPCHSDEFPSKVKRPHYSVLDKTKVRNVFKVTISYWEDSLVKCLNQLKYEK